MWQKEKKDNSIVSLVLLLTLATTPMAASVVVSDLALAQSNDVPSFELPKAVQRGTTVRIDGSSSLYTINQTMKERFEQKFPGTRVEAAANGADVALIALKKRLIDIAAIGRGLTPEEKKQGLEQLRLRREKIAIIVSEENPFQGNLTNQGFARIFRGEVTDWSELGRASGKIRVIDRPLNSDTRESFRSYPVFKNAKFETGATAVQLNEDSPVEVIKQLGRDGIGYVLAHQVSKLQGVRVLRVSRTLPDNPNYPFSQPLVYVYKKNPGVNVATFLGFVTNAPGQEAIEAARTTEAEAIAAAMTAESPTATTTDTATTSPSADITSTADSYTLAAPTQSNQTSQDHKLLLWSILAVSTVAIFGLLLWFLRKKRPTDSKATDITIKSSPPDSPVDASTPQPTANVSSATQTTPSNLTQDTTIVPSEQNTAKHLTPTMAASIAGGAAIAAESTLVSKWSEKNSEITAEDQTEVNHSSSVQVPSTDGSPLDLEAPVTVVNAPYPQVSDSFHASNPEATLLQDNTQILSAHHSDVTDHQTPANVDVTEVQAPPAGTENSYSPLPDLWEDATQVQIPLASASQPEITEITSTEETPTIPQQPETNQAALDLETPPTVVNTVYPPLPDVWDDTPTQQNNTVVPDGETTPEQPQVSGESLDVVADTAEPTVNLTEEVAQTTPTADSSVINSHPPEQATPSTGAEIGTWTTIYGISNNQNLNADSPQTHNIVDEATPATTATAKPKDVESENIIVLTPRTPKWAYVSWQVSDDAKQTLRSQGGSQFTLRLYDVTDIDLSYQTPVLVQQYECEEITEDRYVAIPTSDRNYMAEIGYTTADNNWLLLARSEIVRVFSRPEKDFWFIADTELIIHGATEPGSSVAVAGHNIKLKPDGTFHLRIPFTDSLIDYVMTATDADGQNAKTIRIHFSQDDPEG
ncbi:DUF4912 domain-containing protein [Fischerella thermalis]|uniref:DUF4912 domain-containing protein n=1 Tax=Fischerella thermalis TaxID=372787 RepID=UPI0019F09D4B|nr:DUF4912 domain-containing protein [Fischerella thermalis]MBF1989273.1 DUF4912 domain-containing protein [Fischerella thermalis M58_A2018_009]MBF2060066.1 DUF4912 domain-containing protein [Fischerella thermalis M66_A2018_004]